MALSQGIFYKLPGTSFVYDPSKVEFLADKVQLKDLLIGSTFGANYNTDINGSWGGGVLTGTPFGGASVLTGKLDLAHSDVRGVDYSAIDNANSQQTGCIRFQITTNYSGNPPSDFSICCISKENASTINAILMRHTSTGKIQIYIADSMGVIIMSNHLDTWSPTASQEYEFELNFDITNGETRLFIDGVQHGITMPETGVRDSNIGLLRIGSNHISADISNFKIDNFIVFDTVQHTANYTPCPSKTKYCCQGVPIMVNSAIECDDIEELADLVHTASGSDNIRFSFDVNGMQKYYSGGNWINSDGTYAQANDYVDLTPVVLAQLLDTASRVKLVAFLYSDDGSTTPTLTSINVYYDFGVPDVPTVNKCIVYGWVQKADDTKEDLSIRANLDTDRLYNDEVLITKDIKEVLTDNRGYFDIVLVENASMTAGAYYDFWIDNVHYQKIVPNELSKNFFELLDKE